MPNFGNDTIKANSNSYSIDRMYAVKFPLSETGKVVSMSAYINLGIADGVKFAIYDDDGAGGLPGTRLCVTDEVLGTGAAAWIPANFTTQPSLGAGDYWLVLWVDWSFVWYFEAGAVGQTQYRNLSYDSFPTPFGAPDGAYNETDSIYCTYTPSNGANAMPMAMNHYRRMREA